MSLADYTGLKTAVANDWLHRTDLTSQADDFIDLFESDFNAKTRVRQMEAQTSTASTSGYLTHPTGWLGWKEIKLAKDGTYYHLEPVTDEIAAIETYGEASSSTPRYYKVKGTRTYLYPPPASAVTFATTYYEGVALSSGTNWLLTAYPGAYLYGSLLQAVAFTGDDQRVPMWASAYEAIMASIRADSGRSEWSGQALQMRRDSGVV